MVLVLCLILWFVVVVVVIVVIVVIIAIVAIVVIVVTVVIVVFVVFVVFVQFSTRAYISEFFLSAPYASNAPTDLQSNRAIHTT